jgi:colanic acid biosynthesis glycosyl transferase WcaI
MRVLVLSMNYAPEMTAVAPFTTGLCEHLAGSGHQVSVITTFAHYPEWRVWDRYRNQVRNRTVVNDVSILRIRHFVPRRPGSLLRRLLYDLSFTFGSFVAGLFAEKCDVIYCACPPPTLALTAYVLASLKSVPYVIKLTDLASDAALATGIVKKGGLVIRLARGFECFVYQRAAAVICLCQGFMDKLTERKITPSKLHLISDWADTENVRPFEGRNTFRKRNDIPDGMFLVLHTGNMGKKQGLMTAVEAAQLSRDRSEILWLLVGEGEERALIDDEIRRRGLSNIRLLPLQPVDELSEMYAAADVLLLSQKAAVKGAVIPSKLLTYMSAGRPLVAAVNERSETALLIERADCGLVVSPEDPAALVAAVSALQQDPSVSIRRGANGRAYAVEHFTKRRVLEQYDLFFKVLIAGKSGGPALCEKAVPVR